MDDPQLLLNRVPIGLGLDLDREVPVIDVRDSDDLRSVIQVQIRLFCRYPVEMGRLDLGEHIGEDVGVGFESHDAGVEVEGEASVIGIDVWGCCEDEGEFEEFVKVASDVSVGVKVNGGLDPDGIECPNP